jgi:hypothetical protein
MCAVWRRIVRRWCVFGFFESGFHAFGCFFDVFLRVFVFFIKGEKNAKIISVFHINVATFPNPPPHKGKCRHNMLRSVAQGEVTPCLLGAQNAV